MFTDPHRGTTKFSEGEILNRVQQADLKDNAEIFLMGDMNIDLEDKKSRESRELILTTKILGLSQHVENVTRLGKTKNSRLDLIFSNSDFIAVGGVINIHISEHLPVFITRKKSKRKSVKTSFKGRSYRNYDKVKFQGNLLGASWEKFYSRRDPNQAWEIMRENIENEIDDMCPMRRFTVKKYDDPWITNEIIEMIRDRDELFRFARRSGKEEDWRVAKAVRNEVAGYIRNAKADFLVEQQNSNFDDPKKFWRNISAVWGNK